MERPTSWVQASNQEGAQINAAETEGGLLSSLPSKEPIKNKIPNPKLNFSLNHVVHHGDTENQRTYQLGF